ncbi:MULTISPECIES: thioesterase [Psychrobacter]|uniref:thioesterase n=1 Tax=Psychrobacter TaxID=497 RepID=UPI00191A5637|nr:MULTISPECIES: thioesterase [Psychrobacter]
MIDEVLDLDEQIFVFETVMRVRNTEVDIGQHLTLEALTALISETRVRFLYSKGIKEIDADYQGLIVDDLQLNIVSLVRAREELLFEMGVSLLTGDGGNITTKVTRMYDGSTIAIAQQHFVNYDYRFNKVTTINNSIKQALNQQLLDI